jgi:hypothetical protein
MGIASLAGFLKDVLLVNDLASKVMKIFRGMGIIFQVFHSHNQGLLNIASPISNFIFI